MAQNYQEDDVPAGRMVAMAGEPKKALCRHCGLPIAPNGASSTGWAHWPGDPRRGWQGIRCPRSLTGAEPVTEDEVTPERRIEQLEEDIRILLRSIEALKAENRELRRQAQRGSGRVAIF